MTPDLALKLISQGVIKQGTELEAKYVGIDLSGARVAQVSGTFIVQTAKKLKTGEVVFDGLSILDGDPQRIDCKNIIAIDGMEPDRVAGVYGLTISEQGEVTTAKRRGRKPKVRVED